MLNFKKWSRVIIIAAAISAAVPAAGWTAGGAAQAPEAADAPADNVGNGGTALYGAGEGRPAAYASNGFDGADKGTDGALPSESDILRLANVWAEALKTRDGKPRYDMMSAAMKEKFVAEQKRRVGGGANWNYNIGVSSPWVVSYAVEADGMTAKIVYLTTTSVPGVYYNDGETVTFGYENGNLVVVDSRMDFEGRPAEESGISDIAGNGYVKIIEGECLSRESLTNSVRFESDSPGIGTRASVAPASGKILDS